MIRIVAQVLAALAVFSVAPAGAQDYPSRPIRLIVPLAAGGGIDFTARVMAQKLSDVIGQQVSPPGGEGEGRDGGKQPGGIRGSGAIRGVEHLEGGRPGGLLGAIPQPRPGRSDLGLVGPRYEVSGLHLRWRTGHGSSVFRAAEGLRGSTGYLEWPGASPLLPGLEVEPPEAAVVEPTVLPVCPTALPFPWPLP